MPIDQKNLCDVSPLSKNWLAITNIRIQNTNIRWKRYITWFLLLSFREQFHQNCIKILICNFEIEIWITSWSKGFVAFKRIDCLIPCHICSLTYNFWLNDVVTTTVCKSDNITFLQFKP